jgi:hypothetical protein
MGMSLYLDESGIVVEGRRVDARSRDSAHQLLGLLGRELTATEAGVPRVGRTAHWLDCGAVLVSQDTDERLIMLYFCFDSHDSSPYPQRVAEVAVFRGEIHVAGAVLRGGETEQDISRLPGIDGFGGMPFTRIGDLYVGFDLRRPRNRANRRGGARKLVRISAEWGDAKGFEYAGRKRGV